MQKGFTEPVTSIEPKTLDLSEGHKFWCQKNLGVFAQANELPTNHEFMNEHKISDMALVV